MTHPKETSYTPTGAVDLGDGWIKSSFLVGGGLCVEIRLSSDHVQLRDSKNRQKRSSEDRHIVLPVDAWLRFASEVSTGSQGRPLATVLDDGSVTVQHEPDGLQLCFSADEWEAFIDGVRRGQFDTTGNIG